MAYDETLAERIRSYLGDDPRFVEKKMFGGVAYMFQGNMAVGISGDELMVRLGPDEFEVALAEPGARHADMSGKPMKNWVLIDTAATAEDEDLHAWIERGVTFAGTLPPK